MNLPPVVRAAAVAIEKLSGPTSRSEPVAVRVMRPYVPAPSPSAANSRRLPTRSAVSLRVTRDCDMCAPPMRTSRSNVEPRGVSAFSVMYVALFVA